MDICRMSGYRVSGSVMHLLFALQGRILRCPAPITSKVATGRFSLSCPPGRSLRCPAWSL